MFNPNLLNIVCRIVEKNKKNKRFNISLKKNSWTKIIFRFYS